jgi:glycosyltransferase involved in cell wall biosynthesis
MRILFSLTNLDLGGAQMFAMRLAEELSLMGHEVFVYNHEPEWSNKDFQSSFSKKVKIICFTDKYNPFIIWKINAVLKKINPKITFRNWLNTRYFKNTLLKYRFDIINSQMYEADLYNARVALPLGIPFVITTHGEYELNFSNKDKGFVDEAKHNLASARAVIYTAQKNIDAIHTLLAEKKPVYKIIVGFNGDNVAQYKVDPTALGIKEGDFVIGMVARGIPEKGWKEAMEMFKMLKKSYTKRRIHLVLIGNGEELKALYEKNRIEDMHLLQFTKNTLEYFSWIKYFDAGMLLSYFMGESVPNAIIEYLYFNVPVIATPMGDIKEMISSPNGMAGELVPLLNGRADTAFAVDVLKKWLDDPAYYASMKSNTSKAFEKFNMRKIATEYLKVFEEVVSKNRK